MNAVQQYYMLTKPGIIFGNSITALGGFFLASKYGIDLVLLINTLVGLGLIVASGCVLNNFLDRFSDQKMARTKNRPLVIKAISEKGALFFGLTLLFFGGVILSVFTNLLTSLMALMGFVVYVLFYSILKHKTVYGTEIGSIAGAVPPVVGYTAVSNQFDLPALILFLIVMTWQMPHFFAIAMYRIREYEAASIPVLPLKKGAYATKVQMFLYVMLFIGVSSSLTLLGYMGNLYLLTVLGLGVFWLRLALQGFKAENDKIWARKMFVFSLWVILGSSFMILIDRI